MNPSVLAQPPGAGRWQHRVFCQVPVKTIAAESGKENKEQIITVDLRLQKQLRGLQHHQRGAAGNKEIAVNKKAKKAGEQNIETGYGAFKRICPDSAYGLLLFSLSMITRPMVAVVSLDTGLPGSKV